MVGLGGVSPGEVSFVGFIPRFYSFLKVFYLCLGGIHSFYGTANCM